MGETKGDERRGRLFVFEGIDGSGKTTQIRRATETLRARGLSVVELVEPTKGRFGRQIRALVQKDRRKIRGLIAPEQLLELFIRDRMENVEQNIDPALRRGDIVLLDRYYYSTIAYQGAQGLDPKEVQRRNESFAPVPDLVLYFALSVEKAWNRFRGKRATADLLDQPDEDDQAQVTQTISRSAKFFENRDYLRRVKAIYDDLARRLDFFCAIDAGADEVAVSRQVIQAIDRALARGR